MAGCRTWTEVDKLLLAAITLTCSRCRPKQQWSALQGMLCVAVPRFECLLDTSLQESCAAVCAHSAGLFQDFWQLCLLAVPTSDAALQLQETALTLLGGSLGTAAHLPCFPVLNVLFNQPPRQLQTWTALVTACTAVLSGELVPLQHQQLRAACCRADQPQEALRGLALAELCHATKPGACLGADSLVQASQLLEQAAALQVCLSASPSMSLPEMRLSRSAALQDVLLADAALSLAEPMLAPCRQAAAAHQDLEQLLQALQGLCLVPDLPLRSRVQRSVAAVLGAMQARTRAAQAAWCALRQPL